MGTALKYWLFLADHKKALLVIAQAFIPVCIIKTNFEAKMHPPFKRTFTNLGVKPLKFLPYLFPDDNIRTLC